MHPAFVVFCGRSNPGESTLRLSQILDDSNALGIGGKHKVHLEEYNLETL